MDILQAFPAAYQFSDGVSNSASANLEVLTKNVDPEYTRISCFWWNLGGHPRVEHYDYRPNVSPEVETHSGNMTVHWWDPTETHTQLLSITILLTAPVGHDGEKCFCRIHSDDVTVSASVNVLMKNSYSYYPPGYDQIPEMKVYYSPPSAYDPEESFEVFCERVTTVLGDHSLKLMHNGQEVKINSANHMIRQRRINYFERINYILQAPTEEQMGTYNCITEDGLEASAHVGREEED